MKRIKTRINTLKDLRMHLGVTQEVVAKVLKIDQATYSRYENGEGYIKGNLTLQQAIDLTRFFGLNSLEEFSALIDGQYNTYISKNRRRGA